MRTVFFAFFQWNYGLLVTNRIFFQIDLTRHYYHGRAEGSTGPERERPLEGGGGEPLAQGQARTGGEREAGPGQQVHGGNIETVTEIIHSAWLQQHKLGLFTYLITLLRSKDIEMVFDNYDTKLKPFFTQIQNNLFLLIWGRSRPKSILHGKSYIQNVQNKYF